MSIIMEDSGQSGSDWMLHLLMRSYRAVERAALQVTVRLEMTMTRAAATGWR